MSGIISGISSMVMGMSKAIMTPGEPPASRGPHIREPRYNYHLSEAVRMFHYRYNWRNDILFRFVTGGACITLGILIIFDYYRSKDKEGQRKWWAERAKMYKDIKEEHQFHAQFHADKEHFKLRSKKEAELKK